MHDKRSVEVDIRLAELPDHLKKILLDMVDMIAVSDENDRPGVVSHAGECSDSGKCAMFKERRN